MREFTASDFTVLRDVERALGGGHSTLRSRILTRLDSAELDGGSGSGNWGHSGRQGLRGGSMPGGGVSNRTAHEKIPGLYTSEAKSRRAAKILNTRATTRFIEGAHAEGVSHEPGISPVVQKAVEGAGCEASGWDFRRKKLDSYDRKFREDLKNRAEYAAWGSRPQEMREYVRDHLYDCVRYTSLSSKENYTEDYHKVVSSLEKEGYEVERVKNTIANEGAIYRGINTVVKSKDGSRFELQFHTAQSLEIKEQVHKLYEVARDPATPVEEKKRLDVQMAKMSASVITPDNSASIDSFDHLPK